MKILAITLAAMLSSTAYATTEQRDSTPRSAAIVSLEEIQAEYYAGNSMTQSQLEGTWNVVQTTNADLACGYLSNSSSFGVIKNSDGSTPEYVFENKTIEASLNKKNALVVTARNLNKKDEVQGPYFVDTKEPQFATWAYKSNGFKSNDAYFSFRCRGVAARSDLMICGLKMNETFYRSAASACAKKSLPTGFMILKKAN